MNTQPGAQREACNTCFDRHGVGLALRLSTLLFGALHAVLSTRGVSKSAVCNVLAVA